MKLGVIAPTTAPLPSLALGIDAGPTRSGIALVRIDECGRFHVELGMHVMSGDRWLRAVIADVVRRGGIVAFEVLVGFAYEAKRVQALVETARVEGRLLEAAEAAGATPIAISAREWRGILCRSETASDHQIRVVVEGLCPTIPPLKADARPHVYDGAGIAIAALARARRRPIMLPAAVERALFEQQAADKVARAARSAAGKARVAAGLPPTGEHRSPTRAQSARRSAAAKRAWAERAGR